MNHRQVRVKVECDCGRSHFKSPGVLIIGFPEHQIEYHGKTGLTDTAIKQIMDIIHLHEKEAPSP